MNDYTLGQTGSSREEQPRFAKGHIRDEVDFEDLDKVEFDPPVKRMDSRLDSERLDDTVGDLVN